MTSDVDDRTDAMAEAATAPLRLYADRVTGSSRQRLLDAFPCEIVEEPDDGIDMIVVSTRMPLARVSGTLRKLRQLEGVPIVAIVHAGGEELARELLRSGVVGLVAEGNESAVAAYAGAAAPDGSLVETYEQRIGRSRPTDLGSPGPDHVTGLPTGDDFEAALAEAAQSGDVPRVGFARVVGYDDAVRRLSAEAVDLLRRRLSGQLREIGRLYGAELYSLTPRVFAFVAPGLGPDEAQELGHLLLRAGEMFAPSGGRPLTLAVGHAGPEVTAETSAVRELAQRAMELATVGTDGVVLSADALSRTLAASTELEVLLGMVDVVEARHPGRAGRGRRVGELAGTLAEHLGFDGLERWQIRLAAHLHEIGRIALDPGRDGVDPDDADRRYPELGATCLQSLAGEEVAAAVRHHRERWDGSGPDGLAGEDIPVAARIVAVAIAVEDLLHVARTDRGTAPDTALRDEAGTAHDPTVVEAACTLLAGRGGPAGTGPSASSGPADVPVASRAVGR